MAMLGSSRPNACPIFSFLQSKGASASFSPRPLLEVHGPHLHGSRPMNLHHLSSFPCAHHHPPRQEAHPPSHTIPSHPISSMTPHSSLLTPHSSPFHSSALVWPPVAQMEHPDSVVWRISFLFLHVPCCIVPLAICRAINRQRRLTKIIIITIMKR